jgi:hypothetical protein
MSEWISVDERLPDPVFDWVIVCADGAMATVMYTKNRGFHGLTANDLIMRDITHWQPLPEPPK